MVEQYSDMLMNILTLLGGGGLGWLFTARWERKKAKSAAIQQEAVAAKEWQEVYTNALQMSNSVNSKLREENQRLLDDYNNILQKFREYDADKEQMRTKMSAYEEEMSNIKKKHEGEISEMKKVMLDNSLKLQKALPFVCQVVGCPNRVRLSTEDFFKDNNEKA